MFRFAKILLLILLSVLISCGHETKSVSFGGSNGNENSEVEDKPEETIGVGWNTPLPDEEAELMAIWLSGEITAPEDLYDRIRNGLKILRHQHGDMIPAVNIEFRFPVPISRLNFGLDSALYNEIQSSEYTGWDSLNEYYEIDTIKYHFFLGNITGNICFKGNKNPYWILEDYRLLDRFKYFKIERSFGDPSNIFPWLDQDKFVFMIRDTEGCIYPNGCGDVAEMFYFVMEENRFELVGNKSYAVDPVFFGMGWDESYMAPYRRYQNYHLFMDSVLSR